MLTAIDWVYFGLLLFGVGWAGLYFIGGEFGADGDYDMDVGGGAEDVEFDFDLDGYDADFDSDLDLDHDVTVDTDVHLSPLSPIVLSSTLGAFGAFGLIARHLVGLPSLVSLPVALLGGLVLGGLTFWFYGTVLLGSQGSTDLRLHDFYSATGTVITPIPADGTGQVSLVVQGQRINTPARSATGDEIARDQLVIVQEMQGPTAIVRPTR